MRTDAPAAPSRPAPRWSADLLDLREAFVWLGRDGLLVALISAYAAFLLLAMPEELLTDSWYALVSGRAVAEEGFVRSDPLTVMTLGHQWINQPWLSAAALYGLVAAGGLKLALLVHVTFVVGALAICVGAARLRGASPAWTAWITLLAATASIPGWQLRTQSFAYPLFAVVLWLLVADSRSPSRRTFLVFPLIALWANLHGSAALGAGLVVLGGLMYGIRQFRARGDRLAHWKVRTTAFVLLPVPLLFASPYGPDLLRYYTHRPVTPALGRYVVEWAPTSPSKVTAAFFVLALGSLWVTARQGKALTAFEQAAIVLLVVVGLLAVRNTVWLPLAATMIVPYALETMRPRAEATKRRWPGVVLALGAVAGVAVLLGVTLTRPASAIDEKWPSAGARTVARIAAQHSNARVWSTSLFTDWLLWEQPTLRGRLAFDVRFGMLTPTQLHDLYAFGTQTGLDWRSSAKGYALVVLEPDKRELTRALLAEAGARVVYRDDTMVVVYRPRQLAVARAESSAG